MGRLGAFFAAMIGAAIAAASGCFAVADLERFQVGAEGGGGAGEMDDSTLPSSLELTFRGMGVHLDQRIEFAIIDDQNFVQCRGVIDPVDQPSTDTVTFRLPNAIPATNGPYRLDFFADVNESGDYDGIPGDITDDHAWRMEPLVDFPAATFPHQANLVKVIFQHNTQFTDIAQWPEGTVAPPHYVGADVRVRFRKDRMTDFVGKLIQVRVIQNHPPFHTVALYRNPQIPGDDFEARIGGMVELGDAYNVDVYIDANDNGAYDNPAAIDQQSPDLGWRFPRQANLSQGGSGGEGGGGGAGGGGSGGTGGGVGGGGGDDETIGIDLDFDPQDPDTPGNYDVGEP